MLAKIISYLVVLILGAVLVLLLWPKQKVTVEIPASDTKIDSLATARFEAKLAGLSRIFASPEDYQAFIDSLKQKNKVVVRVPVPGPTSTDTVLVEVPCPCVPESPGQEFSAVFKHNFIYPEGDTSQFRMTGRYAQFNWPLHPSGSFKDVQVHIPPIVKTVEVPKPPAPLFTRVLKNAAYFGAGIGLGYLIAK